MIKIKKKEHGSLRIQMTFLFILVIIVIAGLIILANTFWLQDYYQKTKMKQLTQVYDQIENLMNEYDVTSYEFDVEFEKICTNNNLSVLVVDKSLETVKSSMNDSNKQVAYRLYSYIFMGDPNFLFKKREGPGESEDVIEDYSTTIQDRRLLVAEKYEIHVNTDPRMQNDYMELMGSIQDDYMLIIRTSIEGIRLNAEVGNRYILYLVISVLSVGIVLIIFITRRITKPILALAAISGKMSELDFTAKYTGSDDNEIGYLGKHMNDLSLTLEKTISELKQANNQLQLDLEQREKLDNMRSEFISNVSHELKTPIALVQGYAEGLKDIVREDPDSVDYYCEVIMDESAKMNRMVKSLLELNHLENGEDITLERFDVAVLVRNYVANSKIMLEQNDISLEINGEESLYVWGDEYKIEEVFMNFFSNALNHVDDKKKIIINIEKLEKVARITVFNSGRPIPERECNRIWDKFYKVDKARSREYGGSGIGLSIVKAIMTAHHQNFGVLNQSEGVSFYFELDCN